MGLEGLQCWACAGAHSSKGNKTPKVLSALDLFRSITEFSCTETAPAEMSPLLGKDGMGHGVLKAQDGEVRDKPALFVFSETDQESVSSANP